MELEQRIETLEREVKTLKVEIRGTLLDIRASLPEKAVAPSRWQKKAWVLALINILIAIVLFTNIHLYLPGNIPSEINIMIASWLRAFWVALAFIWLLLQMYPLALLLEQEDEQWQQIAWSNFAAFFRAKPGYLVTLTLVVLVVALVNLIMPAAWLLVALALLVAFGSIALRSILDLFRKQERAHSKG